jgi:hypothetical protein
MEGAGTPASAEMREKAKEDESYRKRLLNYISLLVTDSETMPKNVSDEEAEKFSL